jgi:outer membrane protein
MRRLIYTMVTITGAVFGFASTANPSALGRASMRADPDWTVDAGAGVIAYPRFPGSRNLDGLAGPSVSVDYKKFAFISTSDGAGLNLLNHDGLRAGPLLTFSRPRTSSLDHAALNGLHRIPLTPELGGFVQFGEGAGLQARLSVQHGIGGHGGWTAKTRIEFRKQLPFRNGIYLKGGPIIEVYDRDYTREYFGVSSAEASRTRYSKFQPGAAGAVGLAAAAIYPLSEKISAGLFVNASRMIGDIDQSPIIRSPYGSATQASFGFNLTYQFRH